MGTTLGMMLANVLAVYVGERLAHGLPVQVAAATIFGLLGIGGAAEEARPYRSSGRARFQTT